MNTDRLIESLARDVRPVSPLRRPPARAATWSVATGVYVIFVAVALTSSDDYLVNTGNSGLIAQQAAAIAMALCAAVAAFASVVPGYSRWVIALPALGASAWLATLLFKVPHEWRAVKLAGLADAHELLCIATITLLSVPPALGLTFMLRRGAPINARLSMALALLAAASWTNVAACIASPHQSAIAVLVWHGATLLALCAFAAAIGPAALPWRATTVKDSKATA